MATVDELMARLGMDPGDFVSGARRAGDAVGDLERDTAQADQEMSKFGIGFGAAAATAGAAAGAALGIGMGNALDLQAVQAKLTAQLGLTATESERIGGVASSLYANAYGENLGEVGDAVKSVIQNISGMADATDAELQSVTGQMMSLAQVMEIDVGEASRAVGQMIRTGLVKDAAEGMDVLTAATQNGANRVGDLAATFDEYSVGFQASGISGAQAAGMMTQAMEAGAMSTDQLGDAMTVFAENVRNAESGAGDAWTSMGLDADAMYAAFAEGGPAAAAALDQTMDRLRAMPADSERSALAVALFGDKANEMQASLFAIDPSTAVAGLGEIAGRSAEADAALGSLAGATIDKLTRGFEVWTGSMIQTGGPLGGLVAGAAAFGPQALAMAGSLAMVVMAAGPVVTSMLGLAATAATTAGRWALSLLTMSANAVMAVGRILISLGIWVAGVIAQGAVALASMAVTAAGYVASWALMGAQATVRAAIMAAAWLIGVGVPAAGALITMGVTAAAYVGSWVLMAAGATARAAIMAASWLIAMGPVGWVIAAVVGLVALIIANWESVVAFTGQAWDALVGFVLGAVDMLVGGVRSGVDTALAVLGWFGQLPGMVGGWFGSARDAAVGQLVGLLGWLGGLPGRILGLLGGLGSLLLGVGGDLVRGLWNGIAGMGSWLWNQIMGWIRRVVPGPILQFLGISSPSKWADKIVGRMIPAGIGQGIIGNAAAATDAARQVAMDTAAALADGASSAGAAQIGAGWSAAVGGMRPGGSDAARPIGGMRDTAGGGPMVTLNVYNPIGVPTTVSVNRDMQLLSALGTFRRGATV